MQLFDYRIIGMLFLIYTSSVIIYGSLEKYNYKDALWLMLITLLIGTLFNNFIHVRNFDVYHVIYIFLISTCTDTFALFSGKFFGKHKLSPDISPSKTIEGSIGGSLLGTIIPTIFYLLAIDGSINIPLLVVTTFILTIVGQVGDLFFSSIKRYYKVKDFSNLIPGHGGILDRFDSVLFIIFGYLLFIVMI